MTDIIDGCVELLATAGISAVRFPLSNGRIAVAFEGQTVIGFVFEYGSAKELVSRWRTDFDDVVRRSRAALLSAQSKAWNTYAILLAVDKPSYDERVALSAIEEDLVSARKIVRAGVSTSIDLTSALLPLLPIQNAPQLDAVDIAAEIRVRTTDLPSDVVDAFLSEASLQIIEQILEEQS